MVWTKRGPRKEPAGRRVAFGDKVALVEPTAPVSPESPSPDEDGARRATRRLRLLAGLLSRAKGDVID